MRVLYQATFCCVLELQFEQSKFFLFLVSSKNCWDSEQKTKRWRHDVTEYCHYISSFTHFSRVFYNKCTIFVMKIHGTFFFVFATTSRHIQIHTHARLLVHSHILAFRSCYTSSIPIRLLFFDISTLCASCLSLSSFSLVYQYQAQFFFFRFISILCVRKLF